jgi:YD repeat-containing protein
VDLLGPLDEELNHQTSEPMRLPATTDHRFYDRHWVEAVSPDGEIAMITGIGIYKNMNVCDGFVSVQHDGLQSNVRFSRHLGNDLIAAVGALRIEVVEPFKELTITLDQGAYPLSCSLTWHSSRPAYLEASHHEVRNARLVTHTSRYDQAGYLTGWIDLDRRRFEPERWWGVRDHSWGVRPDIGGFEAPSGKRMGAVLWHWVFATVGADVVHLQMRESGDGALQHLDGFIDRGGSKLAIVGVEHDIEFVEGTRDWRTARYELSLDDGSTQVVEAAALGWPWAYRGTGYESGFHDSSGVGVGRGELVEWDVLDLRTPGRVTKDGEPFFPGHREQPARVTMGEAEGQGHVMVLSSGRIDKYGLGRNS